MNAYTLVALLAALAAMAVMALLRGSIELRRSVAAIQTNLTTLRAADVEALVAQGRAVLRERLQIELSSDLDEAAGQLDRLVRSPHIKDTFATPELYWNFVRPLGALVGELIRTSGQARWVDDPSEGLLLRVSLDDGRELTSRPFDRVLRHRLEGRPGELKNYVLFAAGKAPSA